MNTDKRFKMAARLSTMANAESCASSMKASIITLAADGSCYIVDTMRNQGLYIRAGLVVHI